MERQSASPGAPATGHSPPTTAASSPCPACGATLFSRHTAIPGVSFDRCRNCGLLVSTIARTETVSPEFSRVEHSHYARGLLATRDRQSEKLIELIREELPDGRRLVDVGCSFGRFLKHARSASFEVRGIEPDHAAAEAARALIGTDAIQEGPLVANSFPPASADVVTTLDVLEHIPVAELENFVSTIRSLLRPGGIWLVKVPTSDGPFFRVAHGIRRIAPRLMRGVLERLWQSRYEYPHTLYFNARALRSFVIRFGFSVERVSYVEEVPTGTAIDRLRHDDSLPAWEAVALAPGILAINLAGRVLGRTDAMVMIARVPG